MKINTSKKIIFIACLSICLIWLPYIMFFSPKLNQIKTLKKTVKVKETQLREMKISAKQYLHEKQNRMSLSSSLSLAERVEEISMDLNLFENLQSVNETNSTEDEVNLNISFKNISYDQLLEFLERTNKLPRMLSVVNLEIDADTYMKNALSVNINLKEKILNI